MVMVTSRRCCSGTEMMTISIACLYLAQAEGKEDMAHLEIFSAFMSKVHGEHFGWEQACDMTCMDIAATMQAFHNMLIRCGGHIIN